MDHPAPPRLTAPPEHDPPTPRWGRGRREETMPVTADIGSVVALLLGLAATAWLLFLAAAMSLCSTFGETCTEAEDRRIGLASVGALATFLGVPLLVAAVRRDARWLLAPVVEVGLVVALVILYGVF